MLSLQQRLLPVAVQRLSLRWLALSVIASDATSPKGRGFAQKFGNTSLDAKITAKQARQTARSM